MVRDPTPPRKIVAKIEYDVTLQCRDWLVSYFAHHHVTSRHMMMTCHMIHYHDGVSKFMLTADFALNFCLHSYLLSSHQQPFCWVCNFLLVQRIFCWLDQRVNIHSIIQDCVKSMMCVQRSKCAPLPLPTETRCRSKSTHSKQPVGVGSKVKVRPPSSIEIWKQNVTI